MSAMPRAALGRHVGHVADNFAGAADVLGHIAFDGLGKHQVAEFHVLGRGVAKDVFRRHVAMNDLLVVCILEALAPLARQS